MAGQLLEIGEYDDRSCRPSTHPCARSPWRSGALCEPCSRRASSPSVAARAGSTSATHGTVGTLTLASLTFSGASGNLASFIVDLVGATSDKLNITGLLNLSGTFDALSFTGTPNGTSTYLLASYGSHSGTFNSAPAFAGYQYIYGATSLTLAPLTSVPEPGTWVAGALALAVGYMSRRRFAKKLIVAG